MPAQQFRHVTRNEYPVRCSCRHCGVHGGNDPLSIRRRCPRWCLKRKRRQRPGLCLSVFAWANLPLSRSMVYRRSYEWTHRGGAPKPDRSRTSLARAARAGREFCRGRNLWMELPSPLYARNCVPYTYHHSPVAPFLPHPPNRGSLFVCERKGLTKNPRAIMRMSMGEAVGAVIE